MLVIGLMIVMLAFVNGMSRLTQQSGQPGNVIVLSDGAIDELFSNLQSTETGDVERQPGVLRDEHNHLLCSRETYLVAIQDTGTIKDNRPARRFVQVRAIEDPLMAARVHNISLYPEGKWFSEAGVEKIQGTDDEAIQAVLGEGIAREMGHDRGQESIKVGDIFELGGRKWIAVGITKTEGSTFGSEVWAKWNLVSHLFGKERYTSIVLRTAGPAEAKALADELTTNFKKAAVQAVPETEYFARLDDTSKQFLVRHYFCDRHHVDRRRVWRHEHDVRGGKRPQARYRRTAHCGVCTLASAGRVLGRIAFDCALWGVRWAAFWPASPMAGPPIALLAAAKVQGNLWR